MPFPRSTGILLHPISFPSRGGIGDFGPAAYEFLNWLADARQGLWQVLPLGPPANGNSPYSSTSAFAGNPLLISLERLEDRGWIDRACLAGFTDKVGPIDYGQVRATKPPLLAQAARNFLQHAPGDARSRFDAFCSENSWWLEDFVLYDTLRDRYGKKCWNQWPRELARREPAALEKARSDLASELATRRVIQFFFYEQWHALRLYCAQKSIRVVGDIAIFVDYDSADVWAHTELYRLNENLDPDVVSGVPPDAFSATGQRWGNPLYNWDVMRARGYEWWIQRLRWATQTCDYIRLDHFRGFAQFWEIPAHHDTAMNGHWVDEFGFGDPGAHVYLPHRLTSDRVVYTGTHDNDTTLGWWKTASDHERRAVEALVGRCEDGVNWSFIRLAQSSVASLSVVPIQDVLGLGSEARLNTPSKHDGNYHWRMQPGSLTRELADKLARLAEVTDRLPRPIQLPTEQEFFA